MLRGRASTDETFPRRWAFALAVIFTLTLGIGATTAIFSVVNAALLAGEPGTGGAGRANRPMLALRMD